MAKKPGHHGVQPEELQCGEELKTMQHRRCVPGSPMRAASDIYHTRHKEAHGEDNGAWYLYSTDSLRPTTERMWHASPRGDTHWCTHSTSCSHNIPSTITRSHIEAEDIAHKQHQSGGP